MPQPTQTSRAAGATARDHTTDAPISVGKCTASIARANATITISAVPRLTMIGCHRVPCARNASAITMATMNAAWPLGKDGSV